MIGSEVNADGRMMKQVWKLWFVFGRPKFVPFCGILLDCFPSLFLLFKNGEFWWSKFTIVATAVKSYSFLNSK
jgi:hypothetical protein